MLIPGDTFPSMEHDPAMIVANNVRRLMQAHDLSANQLAKESGLAQTTISGLLRYPEIRKTPNLATIQALAEYFRIEAWQLQIPNLPDDLLQNHRLSRLIYSFAGVDETGRTSVENVAEREVRYSTMSKRDKASGE